jgi:hypothetical protein
VAAAVLVFACSEKEEPVVMVPIPEVNVMCQETDHALCEFNTMEGHKAFVLIGEAAGQLGTLECVDSGGSIGKNCRFTTTDDDWTNQEGTAVTQIPSSTYEVIALIDADDDAGAGDDISKFSEPGVDIMCILSAVAITADMDTLGGADFNCTFFP